MEMFEIAYGNSHLFIKNLEKVSYSKFFFSFIYSYYKFQIDRRNKAKRGVLKIVKIFAEDVNRSEKKILLTIISIDTMLA